MNVSSLLGLLTLVAASGCGWECNASTCVSGCCDASGTCVINGGSSQCGMGGKTCSSCQACTLGVCGCSPGLELVGGRCVCSARSCGSGCCDSITEQCVLPARQDRNSCGTGGASCRSCSSSTTCKLGTCSSCVTAYGSCFGGATCCDSSRSCSFDSSFGDTVCK